MITAYHRPTTLDEALTLLAQPNRTPLGGGTLLSHSKSDSVEAVDLQSLSLDSVKKQGNTRNRRNRYLAAVARIRTLPGCLEIRVETRSTVEHP